MKRYLSLSGAIASVGMACGLAFTQTPPVPAPTEATALAKVSDPVDIDPAALSALERMTLYLGTLKRFEVRTTSSIDEVMDTGQKLQFEGGATYRVKRPDAFFIEIHSDRRVREFYYDGKNLTMFSPRMGVFTEFPAPGTIRQVLDIAEDEYDISLPISDLFRWGDSPADMKALTSALHIGFARINGFECDQYAFRQPRVDWQIWIQRGDTPLPRKLVITTTDDDARPQFSAVMEWNIDPKFDAATFDFRPPADAYKVKIVPISDTTN